MSKIKVSVKDGAADLIRDVQRVIAACGKSVIKEALDRAGDMIVQPAKVKVLTQQKSGTGALAASVTANRFVSMRGQSAIGVKFGWKQTPITATYKRRIGPKAVSRYRDGRGHSRQVKSTADYGGILEYSEKRQLRHMECAYDENIDRAMDYLYREIDGNIKSIMG